jgi:hypothetical protein
MKDFMSDLREKLYDSAFSAGIPIISDDECCQFLAYLNLESGANEQFVLDERIRSALLYAQKRMNLFGGERPNIELLPVFQKYASVTKKDFDENPPEWVLALEKKWGIKSYRSKK